MALIDHIDGETRRIFLHSDTVLNPVINPIDIYKAVRSLRAADDVLKGFDMFMSAYGYEPTGFDDLGNPTYTERGTRVLLGTRIVPFDTSHELTITGTLITDDGQKGTACFDRAPLSATTIVHINYVPKQVEIIEINTGSGLTQIQSDQLADLFRASFNNRQWDKVNNIITLYEDDGVTPRYQFSTNDDMSVITRL